MLICFLLQTSDFLCCSWDFDANLKTESWLNQSSFSFLCNGGFHSCFSILFGQLGMEPKLWKIFQDENKPTLVKLQTEINNKVNGVSDNRRSVLYRCVTLSKWSICLFISVLSIHKRPVMGHADITFPMKGWRGNVDWARSSEDRANIPKNILSTGKPGKRQSRNVILCSAAGLVSDARTGRGAFSGCFQIKT